MSSQEANQTAAKFMEDQAEIMRKYGESPVLSGKTYDSALRAATQTFKSIGTKIK